MQAAGLGIFMLPAGIFTILLEYSASPVQLLVPDATLRRLVMHLAMGLAAAGIIYSPWGVSLGHTLTRQSR